MATLQGAHPRSKRVATVYNGAAPGVSTDILATALTPAQQVSAYRVTVALTAGSVFDVTCTDGTTPHVWSLNGGTALTAACLYTFVVGISYDDDGTGSGTGLSYNFQVQTDGVIECLIVDEVVGPVI